MAELIAQAKDPSKYISLAVFKPKEIFDFKIDNFKVILVHKSRFFLVRKWRILQSSVSSTAKEFNLTAPENRAKVKRSSEINFLHLPDYFFKSTFSKLITKDSAFF